MQNYAATATPTATLLQPAVTPPPALEPRAWTSTLTFALTTIFTRPSSCNDAVLTISNNSTLWQGVGLGSGTTTAIRNGGNDCWPQNYFAGKFKAIYSPGVCPSGMSMVNSAIFADASETVTQARCCASGASMTKENGLCRRALLDSITFEVDGKSSIGTGTYQLLEPVVTIQWAASNLNQFDPPSAPILALNEPVSTTVSSTTETRSPTQASTIHTTEVKADGGGLQPGTKIGIGIGAAVGAVLIIGLLLWGLVQRRKLRRRQSLQQENSSTAQWSFASPMSYESSHKHGLQAPKYEEQPIEMSAKKDPLEMAGSRTPKVKTQSWGRDLARYRSELQG